MARGPPPLSFPRLIKFIGGSRLCRAGAISLSSWRLEAVPEARDLIKFAPIHPVGPFVGCLEIVARKWRIF
jgi:hypothetical protein